MKGKLLMVSAVVLVAGMAVGAVAVKGNNAEEVNQDVVLVGAIDSLGEVSKNLNGNLAVSDNGKTNSDNSFAYNINSQMNQKENYVFSPYSLKAVLAMAANGAEGETRAELLSALGYDSVDSLNSDMKSLNESYEINDDDDLKIGSANSLWINKTAPEVKKDYSKKMKECYNASVGRYSVKELPNKIKAWVKEKSHGLQKNFNASVDDSFVMGFVNTTYLKAKWVNDFKPEATREDVFYNSDGTTGTTEFMHQSERCEAYKDDDVAMIKLDYRDNDKDMSFYATIAPEGTNLEDYVDRLEVRKVVLALPKFKMQTTASMNSVVQGLGVSKMFTAQADFGNIFEQSSNLYVSSIIQDTVIDVDEEGTEAASTTMMALETSAYDPEQPLEMNFNKPFTYFIMDNDSGEILFMGRYARV
jgi:serpin B